MVQDQISLTPFQASKETQTPDLPGLAALDTALKGCRKLNAPLPPSKRFRISCIGSKAENPIDSIPAVYHLGLLTIGPLPDPTLAGRIVNDTLIIDHYRSSSLTYGVNSGGVSRNLSPTFRNRLISYTRPGGRVSRLTNPSRFRRIFVMRCGLMCRIRPKRLTNFALIS